MPVQYILARQINQRRANRFPPCPLSVNVSDFKSIQRCPLRRNDNPSVYFKRVQNFSALSFSDHPPPTVSACPGTIKPGVHVCRPPRASSVVRITARGGRGCLLRGDRHGGGVDHWTKSRGRATRVCVNRHHPRSAAAAPPARCIGKRSKKQTQHHTLIWGVVREEFGRV